MLHEFLSTNHAELVARCREKAALRSTRGVPVEKLEHGVSVFLSQITRTLEMEQGPDSARSHKISGLPGGGTPTLSEIGESSVQHGRELSRYGFSIGEVVHEYGDLCQAITDLAVEQSEPIAVNEFRTLNRCLDNAIAIAVTEFGYQREFAASDANLDALSLRLGSFAHELRNHLSTAKLALFVIKQGDIGLHGATGKMLDRSLASLENLIARSLAEVRMTAGMPIERTLFSVADFIAEIGLSASMEAQAKACRLVVSDVDPALAVEADRDLLLAAVGNLLQNAFKFSPVHSEISLNAYAVAESILIDVEDQCGGLPAGDTERMFVPFTQNSADRSGLGLGLSTSRRGVEANDGTLDVRSVPGSGCIFTIRLPRRRLPEQS